MKLRRIMAAAAAGVLALSLAACGNGGSAAGESDELTRLREENAALRSQLEALGVQAQTDAAALQNWNLSPTVEGDTVSVTLTAIPEAHTEGQSARFLVCLDEQEVASTECQWNGTAYTGTVTLTPQDGLWYYCILTDGSATTQATLTSPENPLRESLVYLKSSLSLTASLFIPGSTAENGSLTIPEYAAQVQLPGLSGSAASVTSSRLVLRLDGQEVSAQDITLPEGESEGSFELACGSASFPIPQMESDSQLELYLECTLSDGQSVSALGATWYFSDGVLTMVVG